MDYRDPRTTLPPPLREPTEVEIVHCSLKVTEGPDGGKTLDPVPRHALVGRDPWCDLVLSDPRCSRQHCEIMVEENAVRIRDLGSSNGTLCGTVRVVEALLGPNDVVHIGDSALRLSTFRGTRPVDKPTLDPTGGLVGSGRDMQRIFDMVAKAARHDFPVCIYGEPGAGKSAVARALTSQGSRSGGPLVEIDCASQDWEEMERQLFGFARGGTSDTLETEDGAFERAQTGALVLDRIDETSMFIQHRLLEVLDHGRVRPVGSPTGFDLDSRIFATARHPLRERVVEGRFSQHLFEHLSQLEIALPPLRDRLEDLPTLITHFLGVFTSGREFDGGPPRMTVEALRRLRSHSWPGNLKELEFVVGRAVSAAEGPLSAPEGLELGSWSRTAHPRAAEAPGSM